ncbi:alpha/beta hydrolase [Alteromonas sp. 1_MG-2023]|uniref:alpha/beta fold hydrolase n=1 Tax=Alteromonas sp. 1_MG-2023 TaxID=3062669 RepID=UPI0026E1B00A|nr:alpha/beta hydrolase [Alteromonas sp. 1_MG-2023]MDO6475201.1 alpha/beta hydrolase [Alteromonas sp. 1_MG-2023]
MKNRLFVLMLSVLMCSASASLSAEEGKNAETTRTLTLEDMRKKYADADSKFMDVDGINVHYKDQGTGPAILLVHGTLGDLHDWDTWAEVLSKHYRVIRFDLPSFGITGDIPNGNYSVDRSHVLIDGLMDALDIEKFGIAGISYGGMVSFRYAATRVNRITSMILVNSAGIQFGKAVKRDTDTKDKPRKNMFIDPVVNREDVAQFYDDYINDHTYVTSAFIQRKLDYLNIVNRDANSIKAYKLYEKGNPQRVLSHVTAPSLVIWGTANQALDTETAQAFIDALTASCFKKLVTFDDGGHYINVERPAPTAKAALAFLQGLPEVDACKSSCE